MPPAGGTRAPLRVAAVSFVAKQKKPKVGLETKVSKNFLSQALWLIPFIPGAQDQT